MDAMAGAGLAAASMQLPDLGRAGRVAVIVAHPDDETLWAGGLLLGHPEWAPFIITLCRGGDPDRAPRFGRALERLQARGAMGDLDDGPDQAVLASREVQAAILALLPDREFDLLLTHGPEGEYTRHRRHEEVSLAVSALLRDQELRAGTLLQFAYEDGGGAYPPRPRADAQLRIALEDAVWVRKHTLITEVYGFGEASWEARTTPRVEGFRSPGTAPAQEAEARNGK